MKKFFRKAFGVLCLLLAVVVVWQVFNYLTLNILTDSTLRGLVGGAIAFLSAAYLSVHIIDDIGELK